MQKAVIYARVSPTGDRQSTARQVADLKSYAATGGMDIAGIYEEHISGAVRNEDRAVLQECLEHCFSNDVGRAANERAVTVWGVTSMKYLQTCGCAKSMV